MERYSLLDDIRDRIGYYIILLLSLAFGVGLTATSGGSDRMLVLGIILIVVAIMMLLAAVIFVLRHEPDR